MTATLALSLVIFAWQQSPPSESFTRPVEHDATVILDGVRIKSARDIPAGSDVVVGTRDLWLFGHVRGPIHTIIATTPPRPK